MNINLNNYQCLGCHQPLPTKTNAMWHYVALLGSPMVGPFCKWTCARAYLKNDFCKQCHKIVNRNNPFTIAQKDFDGSKEGPFCNYVCVRNRTLKQPVKNQFTCALEPNPFEGG